MDKDDFYTCIMILSDQVLANLRSKKCVPLPRYYQNEFNTLLEYQASEALTCSLKYSDINIDDHDDQKYLEIAKLALDSFIANHHQAEAIFTNHHHRLGTFGDYSPEYLQENCHRVVDSLSLLDSEMAQMLIEAQERILELKTQLARTRQESLTDPLTKFYNRKALFQDLAIFARMPSERRSSLYACENLQCYLLMIDLDNFKIINDNYGHMAGDKALIFVARTIGTIIRKEDKAYRYGGDEFIVLIHHSHLENTLIIAEKIRKTIEKAHLLYEGKSISLTVSIGIATLSQHELKSSICKADEALYHAKQNGKNKVHILESDDSSTQAV